MNLTQQAELEWLNKLCKHQLSELVFLDAEVRFLKNLMEKYFSFMLKDDHLNKVQLISSHLSQFSMVKENVVKEVLFHQGNVQAKLKSLLDKSVDFLKLENERIEEELRDLNKLLKHIKKEIFNVYNYLPSMEGQKFVSTNS
jgi:hypothetical protein